MYKKGVLNVQSCFLLITPIVVIFFYVLLAVAEIFVKAPHCACVKGLET